MSEEGLTFACVQALQADGVQGWKDISAEAYRTYYFPDGHEYRIDDPVALHVSASGGHRVIVRDGRCYYIPAKWLALVWDNTNPNIHRCSF